MNDAVSQDILIVDDVGSSRELLAGVLREVCVLPIRMARNGQETIQAVQARVPAVVFLDIDLPDVNGLELLRRIHAQDERIFVVMVSGVGTPANVKTSREHGAAAFILKPFRPQRVVEALMAYQRHRGDTVVRPQPA